MSWTGGVSAAGENWKVQHREGRGSCFPDIQPICPPALPGAWAGRSQGFEPFLLTSTRFNSRPAMAWHQAACYGRSGWLGQTLAW